MTQVNLGVVYAKEGRLEEAEQQFLGALAVDPDLDKAVMNLGVVYAQEGRLDDAVREFRTAAALNPGNSQATGYLQEIENRMGRK